MDLFSTIERYNKNNQKTFLLFRILNKFPGHEKTDVCLECINELDSKIKFEITEFNRTNDSKIYNHLDNDFTTYKDLIEEYEKYRYPDFNNHSLILLHGLKEEDLKAFLDLVNSIRNISEFMESNNDGSKLRFYLQETLSEVESNISVVTFDKDKGLDINYIESKLVIMQKKAINNNVLYDKYIYLLLMYFCFLNRR